MLVPSAGLEHAVPGVSHAAPHSFLPPIPTAAEAPIPVASQVVVPTRTAEHLDMTRWMQLISVSIAARAVASQPLVVMMTKKQVSGSSISAYKVAESILKEGGYRGFYRGFGVTLSGMLFTESLFLAMYESGRLTKDDDDEEDDMVLKSHDDGGSSAAAGSSTSTSSLKSSVFSTSSLVDAGSAFVADAVTVCLWSPFSIVSNRQMSAGFGGCHTVPYQSALSMYRHLIQVDGYRGMFRGLGASLMMCPATALWWACYHPMRHQLYLSAAPYRATSINAKGDVVATDSFVINAAAGYFTSVFVMTLCNPLMVIRLRMQVENDLPVAAPLREATTTQQHLRLSPWRRKLAAWNIPMLRNGVRSKSILGVALSVWRTEGFRGFFRGCFLNVAAGALDGVMMSATYEATKYYASKE